MDMTSHAVYYSVIVKGTREFGVAFVVDGTTKGNVLDFMTVDEVICILRIKTKFHD
jgi:hypothetical protein